MKLPWRGLLKGALLLVGLVAAGLMLRQADLGNMTDPAWITAHLGPPGWRAWAGFVLLSTVATAIGLPRQLVGFAGGYLFGFLLGLVLAWFGTVAGCAVALFGARLLGRDVVQRLMPGKIERIDRIVAGRSFLMALLIRLLPVGSNLMTNVAAGITRTRAGAFIAGSAVGYLPQSLVFSLAGSGIHLQPAPRIALSGVLLMVSGGIGVYLYRAQTRGRDGLD